jgi:hypothetical protein
VAFPGPGREPGEVLLKCLRSGSREHDDLIALRWRAPFERMMPLGGLVLGSGGGAEVEGDDQAGEEGGALPAAMSHFGLPDPAGRSVAA